MPLCFEHAHQGFAQLRVVVVGEGIDEIENAVRAAAILPGQPAAGRRRRNGREATRGSLRPWAIPSVFSISQRICRLPSAQFVSGATKPADRRRQIQARHDPVGKAHAVGAQVGGLGLHHQLGDIDAGRAFQAATVAMDAEVGHFLEGVGGQPAQIDAAIEDAADQVRLGPRRSLFGGQETEDRAHPHLRRLRAALAAAVARRRGVRHALRVPVDLQFHQVAQRRGLLGGSSAGKSPSGCGGRSGGRKLRVISSGSSPTILPGLSTFSGSKICLTCRKTSYSGPACRWRNCVRLSP